MSEKMKRRDFLKSAATVGVGSVLGAGLASACQTAATPAAEAPAESPGEAPAVVQEKRPINVVGLFPLSGFIAADGEEMRNGVVMAVDEINELGGLVGHELKYIDQLTKLGFEVIEIPYDKAEIFGGSLHCTTIDVYREGNCEDYFPKQVKGY